MDSLLFLTELIGMRLYDVRGKEIGRVREAALVPAVHPVRVDRYLVGGGLAWWTVKHDQVLSISVDGIWLRDEHLRPYHDDESMLRLVQDLLDQQIIDAQGRKVVRVSDVSFSIVKENDHDVLLVRDVDIGIRSVVRRVLQGVVPPRWVRFVQKPIPPKSIRWEYCNIIEPDPQRRLRLNLTPDKLETIHPADLADIVEDLGPEDREAVIESIDSEVAAETLSEVEPRIQARIVEALDPEKAAEILDEMAPDEAADILAEVKEETSEEILEEMSPAPKTEVQELLEFGERTGGGLMNTEYVAVAEDAKVSDALAAVQEGEVLLEVQNTLFLVDANGRLAGVVPLARLLLADPEAPVADLRSADLIHVSVDEKQDRIVELFDKYNLLALPVIDAEGRLLGVVTADDVISVLRGS
jgi:CBS domain-containing protein/sporulation protein YlmC with PRC-barrel domain